MTDCLVVFVQEDVVAGQLWQEALDGVTDGLHLFACYVLLFVLSALRSSCLEGIVHNPPSIALVARVALV
jgi:hypothetical protein